MLGLGRIKMAVQRLRMASIHRTHRNKNFESYKRIDDVIRRFHSAGGLRHAYQAYKLYCLHELLEREQPRNILELGSGTTTAVIADYVRTHGGKLTSVDESSEWLENSRRLADIDSTDPRFRLMQLDKSVAQSGAGIFVGYGLSLEESFDLVLVDGPSLRLNGEKRKDAVNDDVFRLLQTLPPRMIVVDGRAATVRALIERTAPRYTASISDIIRGRYRNDYNYFSVFRRND